VSHTKLDTSNGKEIARMTSDKPTPSPMASPPASASTRGEDAVSNPWKPQSWRFWSIIASLCLIVFIATLDGSIIIIALPLISREIKGGGNYIWIANSFQLAQTIIQPLCAQLCNIFGRRNPMLVAIAIFALGSGLAGGATTTAMMIAGRTIQGLGSGCILMLVELVICDLVPLRQRGTYLGIVMSGGAFGAVLGPIVGGALATADWRWIFYMNLPICAVILVAIAWLLRVQYTKESSWTRALSRIDWIGSVIFIGSSCAIMLGLVFGGSENLWSSWRVILPLVLGFLGAIGFFFYEGSMFCKEPSVPLRIFTNRTSVAGFYIIFISSITLQWVCLFWPIYFQGVRWTTPLRSGINFIPFQVFLIIIAVVAGGLLTKFGLYRPLHFLGFALGILGIGLNIMLSRRTSTPVWVVFQAIQASGQALLTPTILPAILASLSEADVAAATGVYSFLRSFGWVWGLTLPGVIFDSRFNYRSSQISDAETRQTLQNGGAYEAAGGDYVKSLPRIVQDQVVATYIDALRSVWIVAIALTASGLLMVLVEKHIPLRQELDTSFGLDARGEKGKANMELTQGDSVTER
jgi:MFS family permease